MFGGFAWRDSGQITPEPIEGPSADTDVGSGISTREAKGPLIDASSLWTSVHTKANSVATYLDPEGGDENKPRHGEDFAAKGCLSHTALTNKNAPQNCGAF